MSNMRIQLILADEDEARQSGLEHAESVDDVLEIAPWAARVVEGDGGWRVFESIDDYEVYRRNAGEGYSLRFGRAGSTYTELVESSDDLEELEEKRDALNAAMTDSERRQEGYYITDDLINERV